MPTFATRPPCVILVEPRTPGNIGMVCRAMANFGASELRLVDPAASLDDEARRLAVFAGHLLDEAKIFPDLGTAISDLHFCAATTRRSGRLRGALTPLPQLVEEFDCLPPDARTGLVFGREDAGLTTGELALCSRVATIPTDEEAGSLNLAQAVILCLYELNRKNRGKTAPGSPRELPTEAETADLFGLMATVLDRIALLNPDRPEAILHPLRTLHRRAAPDRYELRLLRGMWEQLDASIRDWEGRRRGKKPPPESS